MLLLWPITLDMQLSLSYLTLSTQHPLILASIFVMLSPATVVLYLCHLSFIFYVIRTQKISYNPSSGSPLRSSASLSLLQCCFKNVRKPRSIKI